ncbi:MAG: DNA alkylation repair protein [Nanoarchaeota archaeon]
MLSLLRQELKKSANPQKAQILSGFFKTGRGEYGEGDQFLGITVPDSRKIAKKYSQLSFKNIEELLKSNIHEERLVALLILVHQYQTTKHKEIVSFYLANTSYVNNWDLVDLTAPKILGSYLLHNPKEKNILVQLAQSQNLWKKRIAIVATYELIRHNQFEETLSIAEYLLKDAHDLIHKAVGWMLREVGKRNQAVEESFLEKHYRTMPRTMLRYAIERFSEEKRKQYLQK